MSRRGRLGKESRHLRCGSTQCTRADASLCAALMALPTTLASASVSMLLCPFLTSSRSSLVVAVGPVVVVGLMEEVGAEVGEVGGEVVGAGGAAEGE